MKEFTKYRMLEMLPGGIIWLTLILAIAFSFIKPLWVIYFIIIFCVYWLVKILYLTPYMLYTYFKYRSISRENWLVKAKTLEKFNDVYHLIVLPTAGEPIEVLETTFEGLKKSNYPKDRMIVALGGEEKFKEDFLPKAEKIKEKYKNTFLNY